MSVDKVPAVVPEAGIQTYLDKYSVEDFANLGQPQKKASAVSIMIAVLKRLGESAHRAQLVKICGPYFKKWGLAAGRRTLFRTANTAFEMLGASLNPHEIGETRTAVGLEGRTAAMRCFALFDATLPKPEDATLLDGDEDALDAFRHKVGAAMKILHGALAANQQVIALYGLNTTLPLEHQLATPQQQEMITLTMRQVIQHLPEHHRQTIVQELEVVETKRRLSHLDQMRGA